MKPKDQLIISAAKVAGRAAGDWDEFLAALSAYRLDQLNLMAQASPSLVQVLQGRAQNATEILDIFMTCREKANPILETIKNAKR